MPYENPYTEDDATGSDAQWFTERPDRMYRLRRIQQSETESIGAGTHLLVQKFSSTERQRLSLSLQTVPIVVIALLQSETKVLPILDSVLGEIFLRELIGEPLDLRATVRSGINNCKRGHTRNIPAGSATDTR